MTKTLVGADDTADFYGGGSLQDRYFSPAMSPPKIISTLNYTLPLTITEGTYLFRTSRYPSQRSM